MHLSPEESEKLELILSIIASSGQNSVKIVDLMRSTRLDNRVLGRFIDIGARENYISKAAGKISLTSRGMQFLNGGLKIEPKPIKTSENKSLDELIANWSAEPPAEKAELDASSSEVLKKLYEVFIRDERTPFKAPAWLVNRVRVGPEQLSTTLDSLAKQGYVDRSKVSGAVALTLKGLQQFEDWSTLKVVYRVLDSIQNLNKEKKPATKETIAAYSGLRNWHMFLGILNALGVQDLLGVERDDIAVRLDKYMITTQGTALLEKLRYRFEKPKTEQQEPPKPAATSSAKSLDSVVEQTQALQVNVSWGAQIEQVTIGDKTYSVVVTCKRGRMAEPRAKEAKEKGLIGLTEKYRDQLVELAKPAYNTPNGFDVAAAAEQMKLPQWQVRNLLSVFAAEGFVFPKSYAAKPDEAQPATEKPETLESIAEQAQYYLHAKPEEITILGKTYKIVVIGDKGRLEGKDHIAENLGLIPLRKKQRDRLYRILPYIKQDVFDIAAAAHETQLPRLEIRRLLKIYSAVGIRIPPPESYARLPAHSGSGTPPSSKASQPGASNYNTSLETIVQSYSKSQGSLVNGVRLLVEELEKRDSEIKDLKKRVENLEKK